MLRVPIQKLQPGMVLARGIPFPRNPRRLLLERDGEITADLVPRLEQLGIEEVWIRYPALDFLDEVINDELEDQRREVYARVRETFVQIVPGSPCELDVDRFSESIRDLFISLNENNRGHVLLSKLDAHDNYLLSHSANVCYLAMLLGMKTSDYLARCGAAEATDLQHLALGCLLHDIGKMRVPLEILNKPGRLTEEEMEIIRRHPRDGYEMVKGQIPATAADVVLNHHQRFDGQGYPSRIDTVTGEATTPPAGEEISVFSRIATIVDVYDAATSRRVYSGAKPPVQVLHEMRTWYKGFFDPVLERAFYESSRRCQLDGRCGSATARRRSLWISTRAFRCDPACGESAIPAASRSAGRTPNTAARRSTWPAAMTCTFARSTDRTCDHFSPYSKANRPNWPAPARSCPGSF